MLVKFPNSLGTTWSWSVNTKRKYRKCGTLILVTAMSLYLLLTKWAHFKVGALVDGSHNAFFFPTLHRSSQPFNHLFSSPLNRSTTSLVRSLSLIAKGLKDCHNFCLHFRFWFFFIQLKIEKIIGYN